MSRPTLVGMSSILSNAPARFYSYATDSSTTRTPLAVTTGAALSVTLDPKTRLVLLYYEAASAGTVYFAAGRTVDTANDLPVPASTIFEIPVDKDTSLSLRAVDADQTVRIVEVFA